ncbi:snRNA-activating protein complex subunit 5 [Leucoraja erinacea]|uniref:snRNA-activating protein complex subunit 5 n=1 Tax=Leucoraja erinaceus TaxID=7782 RepID=UPI002456820D|nr:snRNA-activating protein complex subunit 5 [Leucoraja erinacea]XP_055517334.1 snRNA-activating protein complex subunit 5 [Leucoraja erinacea]
MLSRLQELKKEEEALLKIKSTLQDQLNRLKVEELALRSMIMTKDEGHTVGTDKCGQTPESMESLMQVDNENTINQTQLQLNTSQFVTHIRHDEEEEEVEEEEDEEYN